MSTKNIIQVLSLFAALCSQLPRHWADILGECSYAIVSQIIQFLSCWPVWSCPFRSDSNIGQKNRFAMVFDAPADRRYHKSDIWNLVVSNTTVVAACVGKGLRCDAHRISMKKFMSTARLAAWDPFATNRIAFNSSLYHLALQNSRPPFTPKVTTPAIVRSRESHWVATYSRPALPGA